jgi:hypothetical protein
VRLAPRLIPAPMKKRTHVETVGDKKVSEDKKVEINHFWFTMQKIFETKSILR